MRWLGASTIDIVVPRGVVRISRTKLGSLRDHITPPCQASSAPTTPLGQRLS